MRQVLMPAISKVFDPGSPGTRDRPVRRRRAWRMGPAPPKEHGSTPTRAPIYFALAEVFTVTAPNVNYCKLNKLLEFLPQLTGARYS